MRWDRKQRKLNEQPIIFMVYNKTKKQHCQFRKLPLFAQFTVASSGAGPYVKLSPTTKGTYGATSETVSSVTDTSIDCIKVRRMYPK